MSELPDGMKCYILYTDPADGRAHLAEANAAGYAALDRDLDARKVTDDVTLATDEFFGGLNHFDGDPDWWDLTTILQRLGVIGLMPRGTGTGADDKDGGPADGKE